MRSLHPESSAHKIIYVDVSIEKKTLYHFVKDYSKSIRNSTDKSQNIRQKERGINCARAFENRTHPVENEESKKRCRYCKVGYRLWPARVRSAG